MKIEQIRWIDSCSTDSWEPIKGERAPISIMTVGYVVFEDEACISVASSVTQREDESNDCCMIMTIPKICISQRIIVSEYE